MNALPPLCLIFVFTSAIAQAQIWKGLIDASQSLHTERYTFKGGNPTGGPGNENYYDGDFADFDGDGRPDRGLGARYGLLRNRGDGWMEPYAGFTGFLFRGMPGAGGWGEDGFQWADVDNDGDYDILQGGNGEPLTLQINSEARFRLKWNQRISALNIVNTDIEGDGDVDLVVAHAFCANRHCGGPQQFTLLVNDGQGNFTDEARKRGLPFSDKWYGVTGVVSGDVDGDGDYDLLISHGHEKDESLRHISVALNNGAGTYEVRPTRLPPAGSGFSQGMNLGDIDGDGDLDFVMANGPWEKWGQHAMVHHIIALNDGRGNFIQASDERFVGHYAEPTVQYGGGNGKLFDIDYDGDLDFAAHNPKGGYFQIYQNDGEGFFTFDPEHSIKFTGIAKGLGSDVDITDLNGDGTYDIWLGSGADNVHILLNTRRNPGALPDDVPRELKVLEAKADGIKLQWEAPKFAANVRYYKVYRSLAPGMDAFDQTCIGFVGERHQDEGFTAPVTEPIVSYTDTTAQPGIRYQYSVQHVGTENSHSRHSAEVSVMIPAASGRTDRVAPELAIIGPTRQSWSQLPRIVLQYADGGSGIDLSTLEISFDHALADGTPAGQNLAKLAFHRDANDCILPMLPPKALPLDQLVTMTVHVSDRAGNKATQSTRFFVRIASASPPQAVFSTRVLPDHSLELDAGGSSDDQRILRCEWYFQNGSTAIGHRVTRSFAAAGPQKVLLLVRDNDGGVGVARQSVEIR